MKKNKILIAMLAIAALLPVGTSCSGNESEEVMNELTDKHTVNISTRTAEEGAEIDWPLTLYAFDDSSKKLVTSTTVNNAETAAELRLNKGIYTLVALAGADDLAIPTDPMLTDDIGVPESCILTTAPQMAISSSITVASDDIDTDMLLTYPVAQVKMTLTDMPTNITSATATLSPLYTSIAFNGTTDRSGSATLTLTKQDDGSWASANTFVMPSAENLSLTITAGDESYPVTTTSKLEAGKTYTLKGSYNGEVKVSVSFGIQNWTSGDEIEFDITGKEDTDSDDDPLTVTTIPAAKTIWNGHFVATILDQTETTATLLLMSLDEWEATTGNAATTIAAYTEGEMNGWRIPTADEMKAIATTFGSTYTIAGINTTLTGAGGDALTQSANYLCEEGSKIVTMGTNPSALNASAGTTYRLRAVKTVTVTIQE